MWWHRPLKWLLAMPPHHRIVRVKSWKPTLDFGPWGFNGIGWPTLLVDRPSHRTTDTPIWDRVRLRLLVCGNRDRY